MKAKTLTSKLLAVVLTVALALAMLPTVAFASTTGDDGAYDGYNTVPSIPDTTTVRWNGLTWDIIGYNYQGAKHGVAGPANTATLLLDKKSYDSENHWTYFDDTSSYSNQYQGSTLQSKITSFYNGLSDKSNIVTRNLTGGSAFSDDVEGYTGNTIAGSAANSQNLWPLSVTEASQLKASVRTYGEEWWLRSPGYDSGYDYGSAAYVGGGAHVDADENDVYFYGSVNACGNRVYYDYAMRPALYLDLSSLVFSSCATATSNGTLKIGAYDEILKVTDADGYTWDIIGVNGSVNKGVSTPNGHATLLLSNSSVKKFDFPNQASDYSGKIYGLYNTRRKGHNNKYSESDLKNAMNSARTTLKDKSEYNDGQIKTRDLAGGAANIEYGERVAGENVPNQGLWPLSEIEARTLTNQQRIFGSGWWLRSPGHYSDLAAFVHDYGGVDDNYGSVNSGGVVRPALYLNLSSSIFSSLTATDPNWQSKVVGSPDTYTVHFDPNGGKVNSTTKKVDYCTSIGILPTPTRPYSKFLGWYTAKKGGTKVTTSTVISENLDIYAHWKVTSKPAKSSSSAVVNHADFKKHVKFTAPAKKAIKKNKSNTIKLTVYKNVTVKFVTLDKGGKKLKLKVTKGKNSIKVKAGSKKGKAKITITLANGNKKTITVTVK